MNDLRPDETKESNKPKSSFRRAFRRIMIGADVCLAIAAGLFVASTINYCVESRTSTEISSVVRRLDGEQTVEQAFSNYMIFSNLETEAQRDGYSQNVADTYLIPLDVSQNYHDEVNKRLDRLRYEGDHNYKDELKIRRAVINQDSDLQAYFKGEGKKKLEAIVDDVKPCIDEIYPDNTIHAGNIQFSDDIEKGGEYRPGIDFLNDLVVIAKGEITISSVFSLDEPTSTYYASIAHELAHSFETSDSGNETKTQVRSYNILACAANKGSILAQIALFKELKEDAWRLTMLNAKTEKQGDALNDLIMNMPANIPTPVIDFSDLKDKESIKYSLNPFGYVLDILVNGKRDFGWGSLDSIADYVGNKYNAEALRQYQRAYIIGSLPNLQNIALNKDATAWNSLDIYRETRMAKGTNDDHIFYPHDILSHTFWPSYAVDGDVRTRWQPFLNGSALPFAFLQIDLGENSGYSLLRISSDDSEQFLANFKITTGPDCINNELPNTVFVWEGDYSTLSALYSQPAMQGFPLLIPINRTTDRCIALSFWGLNQSDNNERSLGITEFEVYDVP